jgi:hypothetical protein
MNLVEVAKWIQEGYRKYYYLKTNNLTSQNSKDFIMDHVLKLGKGKLNPKIINELVDLETSVADKKWPK